MLPIGLGETSAAGIRQQQNKLFYVSPFIEMAARYHFRVSPPGERIKLRILETDRDGPLLAATFNGRRRDLTTAALLRSLFSLPLVSFKIVAAIHWEALKLWLKGARLVPRTNAAPASHGLAAGGCNDYSGPALSAAGADRSRRAGPDAGSAGRAIHAQETGQITQWDDLPTCHIRTFHVRPDLPTPKMSTARCRTCRLVRLAFGRLKARRGTLDVTLRPHGRMGGMGRGRRRR